MRRCAQHRKRRSECCQARTGLTQKINEPIGSLNCDEMRQTIPICAAFRWCYARIKEKNHRRGALIRSQGGGSGTTRFPSQLRCPRHISATLGQDTGHAASRAWLITAVAYHQQRTPALQEEAAINIGALNRRVADLDIESAIRKGAVFVSSRHMLRPSR